MNRIVLLFAILLVSISVLGTTKSDIDKDRSIQKTIDSLVFENNIPGLNLYYGMGSFIFNTPHGKAYGHTWFVPDFVSIYAFSLSWNWPWPFR